MRTECRTEKLAWQSYSLLIGVVLLATGWAGVQCWMAALVRSAHLWQALAISIGFALIVWILRAATVAAALTGALLTMCIYFEAPGTRTALWPLLGMLVLTLGATRTGRKSKEQLGVAEAHHGRGAAQVAANIGIAALAALPSLFGYSRHAAFIVIAAALGEAAADTLSSELGQAFGGTPRLVTSGKRVPPGTDGAITLAGTLAGIAGAAIVIAVAGAVFPLGPKQTTLAFAAAIIGFSADTLLGAIFERRGWMNNDAVNFASTLIAGLLAAWFRVRYL